MSWKTPRKPTKKFKKSSLKLDFLQIANYLYKKKVLKTAIYLRFVLFLTLTYVMGNSGFPF